MRVLFFGSILLLPLTISPVQAQQPRELPGSLPPPGPAAATASPLPALTEAPVLGEEYTPCVGVEEASCGFWARGEYLLYWIRKAPLNTRLLTTDPTNGMSPSAGGLADPSTLVVLGGTHVDFNDFSGGRLHVGCALADGLAFEAGGFILGSQGKTFQAVSDGSGNPFLFRPFIDVDTLNPNAGSVVAAPGLIAGGMRVNNFSQAWGADCLCVGDWMCARHFQLAWLLGFRYLNLTERLDIQDARTDLAGVGSFNGLPTSPGDQFQIFDNFHTQNRFLGGGLGLCGEAHLGPLVLAGSAQVSVGDTEQIIRIDGSSTLVPAAGGGVTTLPGGILALPSNIGHFKYDHFSVVPEVSMQLGYELTSRVRLAVGYDFLYWSEVVRPGDQVVPLVSNAQVPTSPTFGMGGSPFPPPPHRSTDFWVQGLNFTVAVRF